MPSRKPATDSDEIVVTDEMVEAGVRAFDAWAEEYDYFDGGYPSDGMIRDGVASIMRSMISASPQRLSARLSPQNKWPDSRHYI